MSSVLPRRVPGRDPLRFPGRGGDMGAQLRCFCSDAYARSPGWELHPGILGAPGRAGWVDQGFVALVSMQAQAIRPSAG